MKRDYPQDDTPESLEGNAAHWLFAEMLAGREVLEGATATNGVIVTDEMLEGAELFVDTVRQRMPRDRFNVRVEELIACHFVHQQCWGTPDVWGYDGVNKVLEVIDYKYGHRFVDEYENDQGVTYISGCIDEIAAIVGMQPAILDQKLTVNFTIVQPRCFYKGSPVRTWSVKGSDLRAQVNKLKRAADLALSPNPVAVTNSECRDCSGRHACPALQKAAYADAEFSAMSTPVELSPQASSLELKMLERALERLQARVEGLRESVTAYVRQGYSVPWHRAEQSFGRQQWAMPAEQVIAMGELMGANLSKPGVKTPKQAIKLGIDEGVISAYTVTPLGSMKLVPDNPADARRVFGTTSM